MQYEPEVVTTSPTTPYTSTKPTRRPSKPRKKPVPSADIRVEEERLLAFNSPIRGRDSREQYLEGKSKGRRRSHRLGDKESTYIGDTPAPLSCQLIF